MPVRPMWKAFVRFGNERLPVKLYSALEDRVIHFHLLDEESHVRVKQ